MRTTLIIPVFNFEKRLQGMLDTLRTKFSREGSNIEIILVNDGSTDATQSILNTVSAPFKVVHHEKNRGKGAAIKTGVSVAQGDHIFFTDADIPYDLSAMDSAHALLDQGYDVVLGSRAVAGSSSVRPRTLLRRLSSFVFSRLANLTLLNRIEDTQCGFKSFKNTVAKNIFSQVHFEGFVFDVEVIYRAQKSGAKIGLVPVRLVDDTDSSVRMMRDSYRMARDLVKLYFYTRMGAGSTTTKRA